MNKIKCFLLICAIPLFCNAQYAPCGSPVPSINCPSDNTLCIDEQSPSMTLSNTSGYPDVEYAIIDQNQLSQDGENPALIGFTDQPNFIASDFGVTMATTLEFFPIAYDNAKIQNIIDFNLTGIYQGAPCCEIETILTGLCDAFVAAGISQGSDFTSLNQMLTIFAPGGEYLSIFDINLIIFLLNDLFMDTQTYPPECGGGVVDEICYAYGSPCIFEITTPTTLIEFDGTDHTMSETAYADKIESSASVKANQTVIYQYRNEVVLKNNFQTIGNGQLSIEKKTCTN